MAFALSGFSTIAQNFISKSIASNFYPRLQLLSAIGAFTLTRNKKTSLNIGRPGCGEILSGKMITKAEVERLPAINGYQPRIQGFETSNSKWMGKYDTNPIVGSSQTLAHSQVGQNSALFYRAELKTPILVWHRDKERCSREGTERGRGLAMAQLLEEATEVAYQEHVKELNAKMWTGNPTSQSADPWDQPLGIMEMLSATNTYGGVDRSVAAHASWRAIVDTTLTATDLDRIVDDANVTKSLKDLGSGVNLGITTKALYLQFKAQAQAAGSVVRVLPEGIPGMAAMGVKQECLLKDNTYVMYDSTCPANNFLGLNLETMKIMIFPGKNLTVSKWVDLSTATEGAKNADQAFINTEILVANDNPALNIKYTAIGT